MSKLFRRTFLFLALMICCQAVNSAQSRSPLENLPPNVEILSHFGERAVWSSDGKRVAFVHRTLGDAFEIGLETREIPCLTCTFEHAGFFRVHYLRSGDFIMIGPAEKIDRSSARWNHSELWFLRRDRAEPPLRLNQKLNEGLAVSRQQSIIAWSESSNLRDLPAALEDRSILIRMKRKAPKEKIDPLRWDHIGAELHPTRERIVRWVSDFQVSPRLPCFLRIDRV